MRISRLFLPASLQSGESVTLNSERAHYLRTVLRLKKGDALTVFNGRGCEFAATVREMQREAVRIELGERHDLDQESPLKTHLGLGISRGERMDLAIQKSVELGASEITPLFTERCVVRLDEARQEHRVQHWQKVAQSACEQCGRNRVPVLNPPVGLSRWIELAQGVRLILHPYGGKRLHELDRPGGPVTLLSGPEGGFSENERLWAMQKGFIPLRLGPRILRAETAALAALAAIQAVWGDLG